MGFLDVLSDPKVISTAGSVLGSLMSDDDDNKSETIHTTKVQPRTESSANLTDFDILYRDLAVQNMDVLTERMQAWSAQDQGFMQRTYRPFQEQLMQTNAQLLPVIERTNTAALETISRDIANTDNLKNFLTGRARNSQGMLAPELEALQNQISEIPTTEERVGQALTSVESQFSQAGKELSREFQQRGQTVSQASARGLAVEKAKAKAGAAGAAKEAARKEQLAGAQLGLSAAAQAEQTRAGIRAQDVAGLANLQQGAALGLEAPQVGGVTEADRSLAGTAAGLAQTAGTQSFGTRQRQDQISHTQKGIKEGVTTSGAGSGGVSGATAGVTQAGGGVIGDAITAKDLDIDEALFQNLVKGMDPNFVPESERDPYEGMSSKEISIAKYKERQEAERLERAQSGGK